MAVTYLEGATAKRARPGGNTIWRWPTSKRRPETWRQTLDAALKMDPNLPEAQAARQVFGIARN